MFSHTILPNACVSLKLQDNIFLTERDITCNYADITTVNILVYFFLVFFLYIFFKFL